MEPSQGIKTWQWVVTVIVIIILVIVGIIVFGGNKSAPTTTDNTPAPAVSTAPTTNSNRIIMSDQYPGDVVHLDSVQVAQPSWVVIQTDKAGQPDKIIGSTHFDTGVNPGQVTLTQPTIDGGTYYATIFTDDGSGKFSAKADVPLKDANGSVIMHVFHASASATTGTKE